MRAKMLVFVSCLFLLFCALASCGGSGGGSTTTAPTTTAPTTTTAAPAPKTPEAVGISSENIKHLITGLRREGLSMHSIVVMRYGEVVAEGYADPIDENTLHRMYSVSKSFTAMAVGLLAESGEISLDDTIDTYFPEYVTEDTDPRITATTIEDLLRMASPYNGSSYSFSRNDWVASFFEGTVKKEPGTGFAYDTSATYLLCAIVERVSGVDFLEYLKENALLEIGFSEDAWCVDAPDGYAWGGSGVMCTSRDLAAFANLVMHKGEYNGKQLLPRDFCEAATSKQIDTTSYSDKVIYGSGYGYQIWMNPHGFGFMGMGSQNAYCIPEKDLVIVCTADTQGRSDAAVVIYELFEEYIINTASDTALPENETAYADMQRTLRNMEIPCQEGDDTSSVADAVNGVTFTAVAENTPFTAFTLALDDAAGRGTLTYDTARGQKTITFGLGYNHLGVLDEPQYSGATINTPKGEGYRCLASGAWESDTVFVLWVQVVDDYFGNMRLTFDFSGDGACVNGKENAEAFLDEYVMKNAAFVRD